MLETTKEERADWRMAVISDDITATWSDNTVGALIGDVDTLVAALEEVDAATVAEFGELTEPYDRLDRAILKARELLRDPQAPAATG